MKKISEFICLCFWWIIIPLPIVMGVGVFIFMIITAMDSNQIKTASCQIPKFKWHTPTNAFIKNVEGDIVKIEMDNLRGFYNVNDKVYLIYLSDTIISTDHHGICRVINARYGVDAPCYLGE